ncbi:SET domain-containing protein SmydA-8 isoform X3 [Musca domestica]|uniref:SET domain-containing protein SmydA-8 isoform X3 n=1 Tax=Musca domestica TaxID=7370 RepID=A0ABM3UW94_MUSDO|nr:SET domain-containing protein SmydA-8 isoform X3 [Musca domestica]
MPLKFNISTPNLAKLIKLHLGPEILKNNNAWEILESPLSGRGIFAVRDIDAGEVILSDIALTTGPTSTSHQHICCVCYKTLEDIDRDIQCKNGCSLPLCELCSNGSSHSTECELFRRWKPKEPTQIIPQLLRFVSIVRCLFLGDTQRKLLLALQANNDKYYANELQKVAQCFANFPSDREMLEYFQYSIAAFNTNAFEGSCDRQQMENRGRVRALFPLASLLNHQCTPNADHYFDSPETLVIIATRPISKGEEIVTSYTKLLWSTLMRKMFLKMTKHFECCCPRCVDPSENGTYLSALFCRQQGCKGIMIPVQTKTLQPDWRCLTCESVFPHSKMARYQDFALNTINNRINACSISDMITFINDMCPRFCPPSNYVLVEAKLNVIWRMSRATTEVFTEEQLKCKDRYRAELLELLEKLGAGECTLKKLITEERL